MFFLFIFICLKHLYCACGLKESRGPKAAYNIKTSSVKSHRTMIIILKEQLNRYNIKASTVDKNSSKNT